MVAANIETETALATLNFDGTWLITSQDGMAKLMKSLGVGWMKVKVVSSANFGVGKHQQAINQEDDIITIKTAAWKTFTNVVQVGGGEQVLNSMDGKVKCTASWGADGSLVMETTMFGQPVTVTRRIKNGNTMEMTLCNGKDSAVQLWTRQ